eukprot:TRINITY_DN39129_c0_g1_i1.p1 TRINITY_DN39129_c0_g1~~TRINITY_DN39129_c0_g1_i1.p1  ORF type:complete len:192 (-),score=65.09 TRINITY_DN39129_c0_g1_i1:67-642(-)
MQQRREAAERQRREAAQRLADAGRPVQPPMPTAMPAQPPARRVAQPPAPPPAPAPVAAPAQAAPPSRNEDLDKEIRAQVEQVIRTEIEELKLLGVQLRSLRGRPDQKAEHDEAMAEYTARDTELKQLQQHMALGQYEAAAQRVLQGMEDSGMGATEEDYAELPRPKILTMEEELMVCQHEMQQWRAYFKAL